MTVSDIRDALLIAAPVVWGARALWRRLRPALGPVVSRVRDWSNRPVAIRLDVVEEKVEDLGVHVEAIERNQR
jgi:hypothetical protein